MGSYSNDGPEPDRVELLVRFVCGSIFGLSLGVLVALNMALSSLLEFFGLLGLFAAGCGVLALRFGDRFWWGLRHLRHLLWFWP